MYYWVTDRPLSLCLSNFMESYCELHMCVCVFNSSSALLSREILECSVCVCVCVCSSVALLSREFLECSHMLEYCFVSQYLLPLVCACSVVVFCSSSQATYTFNKFNIFWVKEKPDNVMAFPSVKDQFAANLKTKLSNTPPTLMRIINRE